MSSSARSIESGRRQRGLLFIVSAPSGTGKTTLVERLVQMTPHLRMSRSYTSRPARAGERDGVDYNFITRDRFEVMIREGAFLEYAVIYGNYYGTLKSEIDKALHAGKSMLFDVDVKGALSIKQRYPAEGVLIFVKPPSIEALTERLKARKTEDAETIRRRLERVPMELEQAKEFEVCIVNDDLQRAVDAVDAVVNRVLPVAA